MAVSLCVHINHHKISTGKDGPNVVRIFKLLKLDTLRQKNVLNIADFTVHGLCRRVLPALCTRQPVCTVDRGYRVYVLYGSLPTGVNKTNEAVICDGHNSV